MTLAAPAHAVAAVVTLDTAALAKADASLDGATVRFEGEALGEALRADATHRWVNVLGGAVAIGVYTPDRMVEAIDGYGDWSRTGTIVEVTGVYNVACPQHGGDLDVHAEQIRVVAGAREVQHPVDVWKALVAAAALGFSAVLAVRFRAVWRRRYY